ncbi:hypothetical protein BDN72DRAFT_907055 [Pluteus cervinus]|uniref:Uncharacterized protein n=1 Tax=Pluteus cervinus TaxID=181527 RepID=A0ACD2ZXM2_9AGAR|nr:hypothetical protein BDN72DRAFT_907055 [Pluteus cervinus]
MRPYGTYGTVATLLVVFSPEYHQHHVSNTPSMQRRVHSASTFSKVPTTTTCTFGFECGRFGWWEYLGTRQDTHDDDGGADSTHHNADFETHHHPSLLPNGAFKSCFERAGWSLGWDRRFREVAPPIASQPPTSLQETLGSRFSLQPEGAPPGNAQPKLKGMSLISWFAFRANLC